MKKLKIDRNKVIRNMFLLPILSVVIMSISHVISWYDLGNPLSWAIYLSVAVEVFAISSISAVSIRMRKTSIWLLFGIVTTIQIIGNVFFTYKETDINGIGFLTWVELIEPWFSDWSIIDHRRFLALIQGGTLPLMSLIALHFYIKFNENLHEDSVVNEPLVEETLKGDLKENTNEKDIYNDFDFGSFGNIDSNIDSKIDLGSKPLDNTEIHKKTQDEQNKGQVFGHQKRNPKTIPGVN